MAEADPQAAQQHLDDHYADGIDLVLVDEPTGSGPGMSSKEAGAFLRSLRPVARAAQTLGSLVKKAKPKA